MNLTQKRIAVGVYLFVLFACVLNTYLGWGYFGSGRALLSGVILVGAICTAKYGPGLLQEITAYRRCKDGTPPTGPA